MSRPGFRKDRYLIAFDGGRELLLEPPDKMSAEAVAQAMCRVDPWRTLQTRPERVSAFLLQEDAHCCRRIIRFAGTIAGVVAVRSPWLYGPYLNILAVLPAFQGAGIGSAMLRWMETEAGDASTNLWLCASEFNTSAIAFYERHGFRQVASLPDLVAPGFAELLLRRRLVRRN